MTNELTTDVVISEQDLASLKNAEPSGIDMNIQYWSPEKEGDRKAVMLLGFAIRKFPDQNDEAKLREVPCAVFIEWDGTVWENGSAILVSTLKQNCKQGDKVMIEYSGKKKSQKGNMCSNWKVVQVKA